MPNDGLFNRMLNKLRPGEGAASTALGKSPHALGPIHLGLFGKHRRSPEHLFDLGASAELAELKEVLYDRGIRAAVDQNIWKDLTGDDFLQFNHLMVGWRNGAMLVARVVATRDDLRRTDFPMIVAAARAGAEPHETPAIFEALRALFHDVARATSLENLHEIVAQHRASAKATPPQVADFPADIPALADIAAEPALGPNHQGLLNLMYETERQMAPWAVPATASRIGTRPSAHVRVPPVSSWPVESAAVWVRYFHELTANSRAPVLAFADANSKLVDVMVGDPQPSLLRCLHAAPSALPYVTQIPYQLSADFVAGAKARIARACSGTSATPRKPATAAWPSTIGGIGDELTKTVIPRSRDVRPHSEPHASPAQASQVEKPREPLVVDRSPFVPQAAAPAAQVEDASDEDAVPALTVSYVAKAEEPFDGEIPPLTPSYVAKSEIEPPIESPVEPPPLSDAAATGHRPRAHKQTLLSLWPIVIMGTIIALLAVIVVALLMSRKS